jgi:hypothetical protein
VNEILPVNSPQHSQHRTLRRILLWLGVIVVILFAAALVTGEILLHRAAPMLKAKVIDTLSTRFDSRVELDGFNVSLVKGFEVAGSGLKLYPNHLDMTEPLLQVDHFSFHALGWKQLLAPQMYINTVHVSGLGIHMPPKGERAGMPHLSGAQPGVDKTHSGIKVVVGEILVDQANLVIENGKPGKVPLDFVIQRIQLKSVGAGQPMKFHAILVNPKPLGNIDSTGDFGPFNAQSPGDTPVDGHYSFSHADLSTLKGIGGTLASTGDYKGQLNRIDVQGETTTPDFYLTFAQHRVPLNTKFHAIVDGMNGDTYLQPVDAWLARTHIVAQGEVVRIPNGPGHDIRMNVTAGPGRMQDLLEVATKTDPPLINGTVQLHATLHLPPGKVSVTKKMQLQGTFTVDDAHFNNDKIQANVDQLSLRGQGKAKEAGQERDAMKNGNPAGATHADVGSEMQGDFDLGDDQLTISALNYQVPGAQIAISGVYALDAQTLDFHGTARLQAHVSQMVTGWKSLLLKPVDPFFAKDGAGTLVPIQITGTRSDPKIGLAHGTH